MTIVPAYPGFKILYIDNNDCGFTEEPIIAWSLDNPTDPLAMTVMGPHTGSDVAVRYPDGRILYRGNHFSSEHGYLHAVRAEGQKER
jgi:hypothetical protein